MRKPRKDTKDVPGVPIDKNNIVQYEDDPKPKGVDDTIAKTHPQTDSNIDSHELYDEGLDGATEVTDKSVKRQQSDPVARKNKRQAK